MGLLGEEEVEEVVDGDDEVAGLFWFAFGGVGDCELFEEEDA